MLRFPTHSPFELIADDCSHQVPNARCDNGHVGSGSGLALSSSGTGCRQDSDPARVDRRHRRPVSERAGRNRAPTARASCGAGRQAGEGRGQPKSNSSVFASETDRLAARSPSVGASAGQMSWRILLKKLARDCAGRDGCELSANVTGWAGAAALGTATRRRATRFVISARVAASYLVKKSTSRETGIGARKGCGRAEAAACVRAIAWSFRKFTEAGV